MVYCPLSIVHCLSEPFVYLVIGEEGHDGLAVRQAAVIGQGEQSFEGRLNEQGTASFVLDGFTFDQPLQAHITTEDQQQIEPIEFTLEANEKEYVLQENAPKSGSSLFSIIVFLLILAARAAAVIFGLKPGTEELTKIINKNFF